MENCNLLLGILIISAMIYIIILNNPSKEHYSSRGSGGGAFVTNLIVAGASTAIRHEVCTDSKVIQEQKQYAKKMNLTRDLSNGKICSHDYECMSSNCVSGACKYKIGCEPPIRRSRRWNW